MSGIINEIGSKSGIIGQTSYVNSPAFHVQGDGSTANSIANASWQTINFASVALDTHSFYVTGTDRWLPTDGKVRRYYVYAEARLNSTSAITPIILQIRKNGGGITQGRGDNHHYTALSTSTTTELDGVDDYLEVIYYQSSGGTVALSTAADNLFFGGFALTI